MYMLTWVNNFVVTVLRNRENMKGVGGTRKLRDIVVDSSNHPLS
jgi:hypothetical protein